MTYTIPGFHPDRQAARTRVPTPSTPATPEEVVWSDYRADELRNTLLAAMVLLAAKSNRRQADLTAALGRMGLPVTAEQVMSALHMLLEEGCVQNWVPLYDGGMLVSITNRGMDQTERTGPRRFLEQIHALRP